MIELKTTDIQTLPIGAVYFAKSNNMPGEVGMWHINVVAVRGIKSFKDKEVPYMDYLPIGDFVKMLKRQNFIGIIRPPCVMHTQVVYTGVILK